MRAQCVARRLQRESARKAPIGEHRHLAAAQRTAEQHGDDGAVAQALKQLSAISDQLSVVFRPERDALGRAVPAATPARAENPQGAPTSMVGDHRREMSRHHTDRSGAFAHDAREPAAVKSRRIPGERLRLSNPTR